jgi:hypothetical protein
LNDLVGLGIIDKVSSKWTDIGLRVGLNWNQLNGYRKKRLGEEEDCCRDVFSYWIDDYGTSQYPLTWDGLFDLLIAVKHRAAAMDMMKRVSGGRFMLG